MHEFAFGITSNNPFYGPVKNPWNPKYTPGGSSGGSGAAVAAFIVHSFNRNRYRRFRPYSGLLRAVSLV